MTVRRLLVAALIAGAFVQMIAGAFALQIIGYMIIKKIVTFEV